MVPDPISGLFRGSRDDTDPGMDLEGETCWLRWSVITIDGHDTPWYILPNTHARVCTWYRCMGMYYS